MGEGGHTEGMAWLPSFNLGGDATHVALMHHNTYLSDKHLSKAQQSQAQAPTHKQQQQQQQHYNQPQNHQNPQHALTAQQPIKPPRVPRYEAAPGAPAQHRPSTDTAAAPPQPTVPGAIPGADTSHSEVLRVPRYSSVYFSKQQEQRQHRQDQEQRLAEQEQQQQQQQQQQQEAEERVRQQQEAKEARLRKEEEEERRQKEQQQQQQQRQKKEKEEQQRRELLERQRTRAHAQRDATPPRARVPRYSYPTANSGRQQSQRPPSYYDTTAATPGV